MSKPDKKNPSTKPEPEDTADQSTAPEGGGDDLDAVKKERDTYLENWKRERASFLNHKKWVERERKNWEASALADFVEGLLPFIDDLDRAIDAARTASGVDSLREGFEMTRSRGVRVTSPVPSWVRHPVAVPVGAAALAVALLLGVGWVAVHEASSTVQRDAQKSRDARGRGEVLSGACRDQRPVNLIVAS